MSLLAEIKKVTLQIFVPKKLITCLLSAIIPAFLFYFISLKFLMFQGYSALNIVRDPAQQTGASSFLGFLSNIGTWLWISSAAICFFGAFNIIPANDKKRKELLILSGILCLLLGVDDFFMLHDRYINQKICYLTYAFCAGALLIRNYKTILMIDGFAFLMGGALLALSILSDVFQSNNVAFYSYMQPIEEGFKFIGAATWLYFNIRAASFRETITEAGYSA